MKNDNDRKRNKKKELLYLLIAIAGSFVVFALIFCIIAHDDIRELGTFDGVRDTVNSITGGGVLPNQPPFSQSSVSDTYLVGFDYSTADFLEKAPTVIVKVRYDGRLEVEIPHTLANGEQYSDTVFFDLGEKEYRNIEKEINLKILYELDPEEADPETTCDGGTSWLIIYDKNGDVYKRCGGFCPHNEDFCRMQRAVYSNLPEEFKEYCERYKKIWQREDGFRPYSGSEQYWTKYGVFLDYDGNLEDLRENYDYIVIDAQYHDPKEIKAFNSRYDKYVYSYINIGSIEDFRGYYEDYADLALGDYENWDGEKWVDVSDERWQNFILDELAPELLEKGINGFFVDNCDVYYNYPTEDILEGLAVIMEGLKEMGCDVFINGGDEFLDAYTDNIGPWTDVITGINQECVFTSIDWEANRLIPASGEDRDYFTDYIEKYGDMGAYIFLIEYVEDTDSTAIREDIKAYCKERNYLYYISGSIGLR